MHLKMKQPISNLDTLSGRISAVIGARFASITDASTKVGMSRTSVSQWVAGHKTPEIKNLGRFATVAEVDLSWLVNGTGPAPDLTPKTKAARAKREPAIKAEPSKGLRAFAAISLSKGIAFESVRGTPDEVYDWIGKENDAAGGRMDWMVIPIEIRLTTG